MFTFDVRPLHCNFCFSYNNKTTRVATARFYRIKTLCWLLFFLLFKRSSQLMHNPKAVKWSSEPCPGLVDYVMIWRYEYRGGHTTKNKACFIFRGFHWARKVIAKRGNINGVISFSISCLFSLLNTNVYVFFSFSRAQKKHTPHFQHILRKKNCLEIKRLLYFFR